MFSCFFATSALRPFDDLMALGLPAMKNGVGWVRDDERKQ